MTRSFLLVMLIVAPALAQTSDDVGALSPAAKAEYESKYVTVGDAVVVVVNDNLATLTNTYELYQGNYREKLDEDAFFDLAGRADLAKWYRDRRHLKIGLYVGGL